MHPRLVALLFALSVLVSISIAGEVRSETTMRAGGMGGRREGPYLRDSSHRQHIPRNKKQRHKKLGGRHGSMKAAGWAGGQASQGYGTGYPAISSPPPRPPVPRRQPSPFKKSPPPPPSFFLTITTSASLEYSPPSPPPPPPPSVSSLTPAQVLALLNLGKSIPPASHNIPGIIPKPSPPSASAETLADNLTTDDITAILDAHNVHRQNYQAPNLTWRFDLAAAARGWASHCSFSHSTLTWGENLALAGIGAAPRSTVERWFIDEACLYNYSMTSSQQQAVWKQTGHFTQFVWRSTGSVGCAIVGPADCPTGIASPGKTWMGVELMVCEYDSPGNVVGEYQANVRPPLVPPVCQGSTYKSA